MGQTDPYEWVRALLDFAPQCTAENLLKKGGFCATLYCFFSTDILPIITTTHLLFAQVDDHQMLSWELILDSAEFGTFTLRAYYILYHLLYYINYLIQYLLLYKVIDFFCSVFLGAVWGGASAVVFADACMYVCEYFL